MAAEHQRMPEPTGSAHDIAMMAYRIAERAMSLYERHEDDCNARWEAQRLAVDRLREVALANFNTSQMDRTEIREKLDALRATATGMLIRTGAWLIVALTGGLSATVWWLVTHPHM